MNICFIIMIKEINVDFRNSGLVYFHKRCKISWKDESIARLELVSGEYHIAEVTGIIDNLNVDDFTVDHLKFKNVMFSNINVTSQFWINRTVFTNCTFYQCNFPKGQIRFSDFINCVFKHTILNTESIQSSSFLNCKSIKSSI